MLLWDAVCPFQKPVQSLPKLILSLSSNLMILELDYLQDALDENS